MTTIFTHLLTFIFGVYGGIGLVSYLRTRADKSYKSQIEKIFLQIKLNFNSVLFVKRINKYVYLSYKTQEIIYQLDSNSLHIFENGVSVASSVLIDRSDIVDSLLILINEKWGDDIDDVIMIDNNIISSNLLKKKYSDPILNKIESDNSDTEFTIDDILDRISEVGYDNLSNEEKNFLKNENK